MISAAAATSSKMRVEEVEAENAQPSTCGDPLFPAIIWYTSIECFHMLLH